MHSTRNERREDDSQKTYCYCMGSFLKNFLKKMRSIVEDPSTVSDLVADDGWAGQATIGCHNRTELLA